MYKCILVFSFKEIILVKAYWRFLFELLWSCCTTKHWLNLKFLTHSATETPQLTSILLFISEIWFKYPVRGKPFHLYSHLFPVFSVRRVLFNAWLLAALIASKIWEKFCSVETETTYQSKTVCDSFVTFTVTRVLSILKKELIIRRL